MNRANGIQEIENIMASLQRARARWMAENRNPTPGERRIVDANMARVDEINKEFQNMDTKLAKKTAETLAIQLERSLARGEEPTAKDQELFKELEEISGHENMPEVFHRSMREPLRPNPQGGLNAYSYGNSKFGSDGEFLQAVVRAGSPQPYVDPRLQLSMRNAATGLQEGIPSEGGFLIQSELASRVLSRTYETGAVASRCTRIPVGPNANGLRIPGIDETSRATGSRWGGVRGYWIGEADEKTASRPKFRLIELDLKKLIGLCYATDELLQDAPALERVIFSAFSEEFAFLLDDACINGVGGGATPRRNECHLPGHSQ